MHEGVFELFVAIFEMKSLNKIITDLLSVYQSLANVLSVPMCFVKKKNN